MSEHELMTPREVAALLKLSTGTLANWRSLGSRFLPFVRVGGLIRYRRRDVERLVAGPTSHMEGTP